MPSNDLSATVITAPEPFYPTLHTKHSIYLAGAIDMGQAPDWQAEVIQALSGSPCVILNPRRPFAPDTLDEQVAWELYGMEVVDTLMMWLPAESKAPISLFEAGIWWSSRDHLVMGVADGFYRRRNLEITAQWYGVELSATLPELLVRVVKRIHRTSALHEAEKDGD